MENNNYLIRLKTDLIFKGSKREYRRANMIGLFANSATAFLTAKNGTKNYLSHLKTDFDVQSV